MSEKSIIELREKLCRELDEISRHNELSQTMIDNAHKLASAIKNLYKVQMYEKYGVAEEASYNGGSYNGGSYHGEYPMDSYGNGYSNTGYDNGNSERRGRASNGRYVSRSRDGGRSWGDAKEVMVQQLSDMLSQTDDPRRREIVRKARDELNEM